MRFKQVLRCCIGLILMNWLLTLPVHAGSSGLNTVVVVNQLSTNSLDLGNYYSEKRQIPPENLLRIEWNGGNIVWSSNQFETLLLGPLLEMLDSRGLREQVDCVVLSMDIPFQTRFGQSLNSTTSALFYGMKDSAGPNWLEVTNSYYGSEAVFAEEPPTTNPGHAFLATMITGKTLEEAKRVVDQGIAGDSTFPAAPVFLAKTSDPLRNGRYMNFDNAVFNARFWREMSVVRTNSDSPQLSPLLLGYQTGLANFSLKPASFVPGAIADSLTSYGGIIFGPNDQTTLLTFLAAGAAGSFGTVTEPSASLGKFPDPRVYNYQSRGFSLAECYYQSLYDPHEGLIVGEPLSAPFARRGTGTFGIAGRTLSGKASLNFHFMAADSLFPLSDIDLFVDGRLHSRVLRTRPAAGNRLKLRLNGYPVSIVVPANASLAVVASNLAAEINRPQHSDATTVQAFPFGDRIELRSTASGPQDLSCFIHVPAEVLATQRYFRAEPFHGTPPPIVSSARRTSSGLFRLGLQTADRIISYVDASEDLVHWLTVSTNYDGGEWEFVDSDAPNFSKRFYRIRSEEFSVLPRLRFDPGTRSVQVQTFTNYPYEIQASTDLKGWTTIHRNDLGSSMTYVDPQAALYPARFYRAAVTVPPPKGVLLQVQSYSETEGLLLRVAAAGQPFLMYSSPDLISWHPVATNWSSGLLRTAVESEVGDADSLTSLLVARSPVFLDSLAHGRLACSVNGSLQAGSWLGLVISMTDGQRVSLFATNQSIGGTIQALTSNLVHLVNSAPSLQGPSGIMAEDLGRGIFGGASLNLVARKPGREAANVQVQWFASSGVLPKPSGVAKLMQNVSDLQPRNQLTVATGRSTISGQVTLDTTELPDGPHELTLVAYEGTHARTQTRASCAVAVNNNGLWADLDIQPLVTDILAGSSCRVSVTAEAENVTRIRLFTTGGEFASVSDRRSATFVIDPRQFGGGLHCFYAVVETATGGVCRTPTRSVRFTR